MNNVHKLIKAQKEYIYLLICELNEVAILAHIHGWRSTRGRKGEKARKKISKLDRKIIQKRK